MFSAQPQMGHIYLTALSQLSGIFVEEEAERLQEPDVVDNFNKTIFVDTTEQTDRTQTRIPA